MEVGKRRILKTLFDRRKAKNDSRRTRNFLEELEKRRLKEKEDKKNVEEIKKTIFWKKLKRRIERITQ